MSAHKNIDKICAVIAALTVCITVLCFFGDALGIETTAHAIGYENRLFDRTKVHSLEIVIDDWDAFLETCESETYSCCNVVIDGESVKNVGIRGKGNTSLSSVKSMNSSRYSFKLEFDQYEKGKSYHGLDKLCLNNIIQDNTYMKDYLAYTLMYDFGVDAPLCSYVYITVNGEEWGLYLAVEGVEEAFLKRNYGSSDGDLYKPDSMSFGGGGPGNGKDFRMSDFMNQDSDASDNTDNTEQTDSRQNRRGGKMPNFGGGQNADIDFSKFDPSQFGGGNMPDFGGKGGFGMGSDDVKLKYTDDNPDSYSNIFSNAKTTVTDADKSRLIASLKALSEQSDLEQTVDTHEVLRYFVVHNFLCNGDSYTGQMIHNYYLYEENGQLSMIPWDYNLAFGSFHGGDASSSVNAAIDTPVSGDMSDRPMVAWIFDNAEYTEQYHALFAEFLDSIDLEKTVSDTAEMIASYVEKDPTKFCTYKEFEDGVAAMKTFCKLRTESVRGQLSGTIPATTEEQNQDSSALIDTADLDLSDLGSMNQGGGFGGGRNRGGNGGENGSASQEQNGGQQQPSGNPPEGFDPSQSGGNPPEGFDPSQFGGNPPEGFDPSQFGGNPPEGFDPSQFGGNPPEGSDPSQSGGQMPGGFGRPDGNASQDSSTDSQQPAEQQSGQNQNTRPQMGNLPDMNAKSTDPTVYILLGVSALVLVCGIGFALKFKR